MDGERSGGAETKSTDTTSTEHAKATHTGSEAGGGKQSCTLNAVERG